MRYKEHEDLLLDEQTRELEAYELPRHEGRSSNLEMT
jgi:hypothetical protein